MTVDVSRALAANLRFRPLADTIRDTLDHLQSRPAEQPWRAGLTPAREQTLLQAWQASERLLCYATPKSNETGVFHLI